MFRFRKPYGPNVLRPFAEFYKHITPETFVYLFKGELVQTVAFVLSFCQKKSFIRKVLEIMNNQEAAEHILLYLSSCEEAHFDQEATRSIERWAEKTLSYYNDGHFSKVFRTNMKDILPRKLAQENRLIEELSDDLMKAVDPITRIFREVQQVIQKREDMKKLEKEYDETRALKNKLHNDIHNINMKRHNLIKYIETSGSNIDAAKLTGLITELVESIDLES